MQKNRKSGFTLVEIMIVVAIIGLLAAIAIPSFVRAREASQTNACINNLRQISGAKDQWAIENNHASSYDTEATIATDLAPYLKSAPDCPASGEYTVGLIPVNPACSVVTPADGDHPAFLPDLL